MKLRYLFAALVLIAEAPILATLLAGWLITGAIYSATLLVGRARTRGLRRATTRPQPAPLLHRPSAAR